MSNRQSRGSECIPADGFDLYHAGFEAGYAAALKAGK